MLAAILKASIPNMPNWASVLIEAVMVEIPGLITSIKDAQGEPQRAASLAVKAAARIADRVVDEVGDMPEHVSDQLIEALTTLCLFIADVTDGKVDGEWVADLPSLLGQ